MNQVFSQRLIWMPPYHRSTQIRRQADEAAGCFLQELDVIKRARDLLEDTALTADRVLAADRRCKEALEHDWSDKCRACRIDGAAGELTPAAADIRPYPAVRAFHPGSVRGGGGRGGSGRWCLFVFVVEFRIFRSEPTILCP